MDGQRELSDDRTACQTYRDNGQDIAILRPNWTSESRRSSHWIHKTVQHERYGKTTANSDVEVSRVIASNNNGHFRCRVAIQRRDQTLVASTTRCFTKKIAHTEHVVHAIRDAMEMSAYGSDWNHLADVIQTVQSEQNWGEQYRTANRLQTRIHLYDKYSTNPQGWHRWIFEQLEVQPGAHILELGCGDGTFWIRNAERIPSSWRITLTDMSSGMVEEARCRLGSNNPQFKFLSVDAQQIPFHEEQFDMVIANNMLYHVPDIPRAIREMHRILKQGGIVCTSTMSTQHLQEVEHLAVSFDPELHVLDHAIKRFHLDNGGDLLSSCFSDLRLLRYEDCLLVDEAEPLIEYIISTPMNARERLVGAAIDKFRDHVNRLLQQNGTLEMTKENGIFLGRK